VLKSFSKTSPENSGGAENSAEISGTNGINFWKIPVALKTQQKFQAQMA
jgi:hypothetical protein